MGPGPHAGDWLRRFREMPQDQQQKALETDPNFKNLAPQQQEKLKQRLNWFGSQPPNQQQRILERMETREHLSPDQKRQERELFQHFTALPLERRRAVHEGLRDLTALPAEQRQQMLSSPAYRSRFSDQERQMLGQALQFGTAPNQMKANPDYWRGKAKIDELQVIFYENPEAAVAGLKKGDIDLIGRLQAPQYAATAGDPNIKQVQTAGRRASYLQINLGATTNDNKPVGDGHPALKDPLVRQAIHFAIDKKTLVDQVQNGLAVPADGSIIPPMFKEFFWQAEGAEKVTFDLAKANQILDDAGYKKGADGVRTMPDGKRKLEMRFSIHTETPEEDKVAQFLTGWFKEIGITLTTRKLDFNKFSEETGYTALFDIAISGWSVNPDPEEVLATHLCSRRPTATGEGGGTESFYCDPQYEKLYTEQLKELDRAKRVDLIKQMEQRLYTDAPIIAMYYQSNLEAYRTDRITSITAVPEGVAGEGIMYGASSGYPMFSADVKATAGSAEGAGGSNTGLIIGIVAAVIIVVGGGFLLTRRRKSVADDRE